MQQLCGLTLDELLALLPVLPAGAGAGAGFPAPVGDLRHRPAAAYAQRMSEVGKKGYGMFAKHHVFTVENGQLVPVKYPDPQRLSELPGYEKEREKGHCQHKGPAGRDARQQCCCTAMQAPASPVR